MKTRRLALVPLTTLLLFGCAQSPTPFPSSPPIETPAPASLGLVEINFQGIGTSAQTASARHVAQGGARAASLTRVAGGLDLARVTTGSFTVGSPGQPDAYRYVYATFKVRNADRNGTPYGVARQNLTFVAASATNGSFGETPVSMLKRFDGSDYPVSGTPTRDDLARAIVPTHGMVLDPISGAPQVLPNAADLQVLTESDVAPFQPGGATPVSGAARIFPYGFVVRSANSSANRTLAANPAAGQYDGRVTFAVRIPLQADSTNDPFAFSMLFNIVEDAVTRVTESVEEQGANSGAAARASQLGANTKVMTLCGPAPFSGANAVFVGSATTAGNVTRLNKIGGDLALKSLTGLDFSNLSTPGNTAVTTPPGSAPGTLYTTFGSATLETLYLNGGRSANGSDIRPNPDGSLTYDPKVGLTNASNDTFRYTVAAIGGPSGTCTSPIQTVKTPTVSASRVWYVNNANTASDPTGRKSSPFKTLADAQSASSAGDIIYVYKGDGANTGMTAGLFLKPNQKLIGQGAALVVDGRTIEAAVENGAPNIGSSTSLGLNLPSEITSTIEVRGVNIASGGASVLHSGINAGTFGKLVVSGVRVTSTGAPALSLSSGVFGDANGANSGSSFDSVSSTNSFSNAVNLNFMGGKVDLGKGSLSDSSNTLFNVSGGAGDVSYGGSMSQIRNAPLLSVGTAHSGTLTLQGGALSASNGAGLQFSDADGKYNIVSTSGVLTLKDAAGGISILGGSSGTFKIADDLGIASITNPTAQAIRIDGSSANVVYGGSIDKTNGSTGILIANNSGGTIELSGAAKKITATGSNTAVNLEKNSGATVKFTNGGLTITSASGDAFRALDGGTVTVEGSDNTVSSGSGRAVNVQNTSIGAAGLTFESVSANGAPSGIVLNATGTAGGLTVTGDGTADSGGTIQNTTGAGILLTNTRGPSFSRMKIHNTADSGVRGTGVTNFTFTNNSVSNSGTGGATDSANIDFYANSGGATENNLSGTVTIRDNTLSNPFAHGIDIYNFAGTIDALDISNNEITLPTSTTAANAHGVRVFALGGSSTVARITRATINNNKISNVPKGVGLNIQCGNPTANGSGGACGVRSSGSDVFTVSNNLISGQNVTNRIGSDGLVALVGGVGEGNFDIRSNTVRYVQGSGIVHRVLGNARVTSTITGNAVEAYNVPNAYGLRIGTAAMWTSGSTETPQLTANVDFNSISQTNGSGIFAAATEVNGTLRLRALGNFVASPLGFGYGIEVRSGGINGDSTVCMRMEFNTVTGGIDNGVRLSGIAIRKQGFVAGVNTFGIHNLTPNPAAPASAEVYVAGLNPDSTPGANGRRVTSLSGDNYQSCLL